MRRDPGFTHLHLHTQYSLLDGAIRMKDLAPAIEERGMDSVAVTDHGNMYGAIDFYKRAKKQKVKPIFGCEAYISMESTRHDKSKRDSAHLVLLAKDNEGYKNLSYLISMGFLEGYYYNPRIDKDLLRKHSKGIYGLSACLGGVVNKPLLKQGESAAAASAKEFKDIFEPGHFFLEIQDNGYDVQKRANQTLLEIGKTYDIPMVATADAHYVNPEDSDAHEVLMCIQQNRSLRDFREKSFPHSDELYIKSPQQIWDTLGKLSPEAVENTVRIANACNVDLDLSQTFLPKYGVPEGCSRESYLEKVAFEGLKQRIQAANYPIDEAHYKERLEYELGVIVRMGFAGYFLIVWDFINYAKENGIPVGPGRGSGAGSMVAYSLNITDLDPIPYDLIFERFLNPERVSMPDFDIDFCQDRRGEVIQYVGDKYGANNVGQIVTYSELSAKVVIKDVGRVMEVPFAEINELTKLIPGLINGRKVSIEQALELEPKLREIQDEKPVYKDIIKIAKNLEGLNRQTGIHAAGIVIGDKPLWEYVPMCRGKNGELVTQFAKDEVEEAGLVKFDFLGLKTLTVISGAIDHIQKRPGEGPMGSNKNFDIGAIPLDDEKIFKLIQKGYTDGVFQLESSGFKELLKRLKPDCFEDIVAAVALYRPGPLDSGMVDDYIERKHGRKQVQYPHPVCEPILGTTYGVIVYQEQVMRIAVSLCGFSMGQADILRKAMGKKKADVMAKMRKQFVEGAFELNGMPQKDADDLFTLIEKFAGYAFNKSHSAAYALISYQTAYLKRYYEVEYMASLLSTEMKTQDNVVRYIQSCRERDIQILSPDVNRSDRDFSVVPVENASKHKYGILFGMGGIKGVGDSAIEAICEARTKHGGYFGSIYGFCEQVDLRKVNKKVMEALVKSGAMDQFKQHRSRLFEAIPRALETGQRMQKDLASGQTNLFGAFAATINTNKNSHSTIDETYPDIEEWPEKLKLRNEKDALGFYISGHPLGRYNKDLARLTTHTTANLTDAAKGNRRFNEVHIAGVVSSLRERPLKNGKGRMAFLALEDLHGTCEVIVFSRVFNEVEHIIKADEPICVRGVPTVEGDDESLVKIRAQEIELLSDIRAKKSAKLKIKMSTEDADAKKLRQIREALAQHPGSMPVTLHLIRPNVSETLIKLPNHLAIQPHDELLQRIETIVGSAGVKLD